MSSNPATSGIRTAADGQSYIPASKRADGSTRKEIRVRPGYKPPEDVQRYKSRPAEAQRLAGPPAVPGTQPTADVESKNKNARRREAARKRKEQEQEEEDQNQPDKGPNSEYHGEVADGMANLQLQGPSASAAQDESEALDAERQKKIRNALKKLRAVRELKDKKLAGEKLSADQLVKISKEAEILRDLNKLEYQGPEMENDFNAEGSVQA